MTIALEHPRAKNNFSALAFYSQHAGIHQDIWKTLGRTWTNLPAELGWALGEIPAGEHGKLKIALTDEQRHALLPQLASMGFFRGITPRPGSYDELHITGAKYGAIVTRVKLVRDWLRKARGEIKIGRWVGIFGQRPRTDGQDGTVAEIYAALSDNVRNHPWVREQMLLMQQENPTAMWHGAFATEFELGILAFLIAYDGDVEVGEYAQAPKRASLPGIPEHTVAHCTLILPDGTPVVVLNAPAVIRPMGAPRPTTISGTAYWMEHFTPVPGATIIAVSGMTHWYRVVGDFERLVHITRPDVSISGMSVSAVDSMAVLNNALAELVWLMQKAYDELLASLTSIR